MRHVRLLAGLTIAMLAWSGLSARAGDAADGDEGAKAVLKERVELTKRMWDKPKDYFDGRYGDDRYDFYTTWEKARTEKRSMPYKTLEEVLDYDADDKSMFLYVPKNYYAGDAEKWGVYVHVCEGRYPKLPEGWDAILEKRKLIFAAPVKADAFEGDCYRMALALDTLATVRAMYTVNEKRAVIGGDDSGGHVAVYSAIAWPDIWTGAIAHGAGVVLERTMYGTGSKSNEGIKGAYKTKDKGNAMTLEWRTEFPYLDKKDLHRIAKSGVKIAFYTGQNKWGHSRALHTAHSWFDLDFAFRLIDDPGQKTACASPDWFDKILGWMLDDEKLEPPLPRYGRYKYLELPDGVELPKKK